MSGDAPTLIDGVITLRRFQQEYAEAHLAGEDDEQVRWLSGGVGTIETTRAWIERNRQNWERGGPIYNFAVFDPDDVLVGMVEANRSHDALDGIEDGDANISYGLYPAARGNGHATRAVRLMLAFLKERGVRRAVIRVAPGNERSLAVPRRAGFDEDRTIVSRSNDTLVVFVKDL